jgi:hypothetical protein
MAYCIFDIDNYFNETNNITINNNCSREQLNFEMLGWNVINLMNTDNEPTSDTRCNCELQKKKSRNKKGDVDTILLCEKKAKYFIQDKFFCEKHAKMCKYITPLKECSQTNLKKMKNVELIAICNKYFITTNDVSIPVQKLSKPNILILMNNFFEKNMLSIIKPIKKESASDVNLITIGRNLKKELNKIKDIENITHVIIENQISPIANRMKTIQGMLAQYFIMTGTDNIHIEFVSSINKLKGYESELNHIDEEPLNDKNKYKQHKKDSILICSRILEKNSRLCQWKPLLLTPKKDDLADCFLQGIWYLTNKHKNIINNAKDIEITNL